MTSQCEVNISQAPRAAFLRPSTINIVRSATVNVTLSAVCSSCLAIRMALLPLVFKGGDLV